MRFESLAVAADCLEEGGFGAQRYLEDGQIAIAVLDRGYIFVGRWYQSGSLVRLRGARPIRRWGTTSGLGEIASGGPTERTILDAPNTIIFTIVRGLPVYECNQEAWSDVID